MLEERDSTPYDESKTVAVAVDVLAKAFVVVWDGHVKRGVGARSRAHAHTRVHTCAAKVRRARGNMRGNLGPIHQLRGEHP